LLNKIHSRRFSSLSCFIISLLLFCFIFSLSSCSTTDTYTIKYPKTIKDEGTINIHTAITKDSTVYNFKEDEAAYKKKYKENNEVIVFSSKTNIADSNVQKISREKYLIFLNDLASIKYERKYMSTTDVLSVIGIALGSAALIIYILALWSGSHIKSFG
jgi:hypothetical protein